MKTVKCWATRLSPLVVVNEIIAEAHKNKKTAAILLTVIVLSMYYITQAHRADPAQIMAIIKSQAEHFAFI